MHTLINKALDEQDEQLDELTLAKLKAARLQALAQQKQSKSPVSWMLAGAFSVALVAVIWVKQPVTPEALSPLAALDTVMTEETEMLEQLEFLAWLEQEELLKQGQS